MKIIKYEIQSKIYLKKISKATSSLNINLKNSNNQMIYLVVINKKTILIVTSKHQLIGSFKPIRDSPLDKQYIVIIHHLTRTVEHQLETINDPNLPFLKKKFEIPRLFKHSICNYCIRLFKVFQQYF